MSELDAWRLARSLRESGQARSIVPSLADMAADDTLDAFNRLRATQVATLATDDGTLDEGDLSGPGQAWLDRYRASSFHMRMRRARRTGT